MMPVVPASAIGNYNQSIKNTPLPRLMQKRSTKSPSSVSPTRMTNRIIQPSTQKPPTEKTRAKSLYSQFQKRSLNQPLSFLMDRQESPLPPKVGPVGGSTWITSPSHRSLSLDNRKGRTVSPGAPSRSRQNCPKTMVEDFFDCSEPMHNHFKKSNQEDKHESNIELHNLEIQNLALTNELNVINREVLQMVERLRTSDNEKQSLQDYIKQLEEKDKNNGVQKQNDDTLIKKLEEENEVLKDTKVKLEEKIQVQESNREEDTATTLKIENQLRKTQSVAQDLQKALSKSVEEYQKLENDYNSYKLKIKNIISIKDIEIKALRESGKIKNNCKCLVEHINDLKKEQDNLQQTASHLREECKNTKMLIDQLVSKSTKAERLYMNLKNTLNYERPLRMRSKIGFDKISKDFSCLQMESNQPTSKQQLMNFDKESEGRDIAVRSSDTITTGNLNVADYTRSLSDGGINGFITKTLIQKQQVIDKLIQENTGLKKTIENIEPKKNVEIQFSSTLNVDRSDSRVDLVKMFLSYVSEHRSMFDVKSNKKVALVAILIGLYIWTLAFPNHTTELPESVLNYI